MGSSQSLTTLSIAVLIANGGEATDNLLNPALTHLVVYKGIPDRFKELISRTSEFVRSLSLLSALRSRGLLEHRPRYRKIVTQDWITDAIEQGELGDDADYKP